jgi:hypothetical protein
MSLLSDRRPSGDDVRRVALAALAAALDDGKPQQAPKRFKGVRTLAAGAALYTAGLAAFKHRDAIRERLGQDEDEEYDDDFDEEYDDDEPEAEADEEYVDEDEDEDDFEGKGDLEDEDVEDAEASGEGADEELDDDEEEEDFDEEDSAGSRPPVRSDRGEQDADIPDPPSRKRAPVGRR